MALYVDGYVIKCPVTVGYSEVYFDGYSSSSVPLACATPVSAFTRYLNSADGKVYTTTGLTTLIPDGYYATTIDGDRFSVQYSGGNIVTITSCDTGEGGSGGGGTGYTTVVWFHRSSNTWETACALLASGGEVAATTYYSDADGKHYTDTSLTSLANGYYYIDSFNFVVLVSGSISQYGDCSTGPVIEEV